MKPEKLFDIIGKIDEKFILHTAKKRAISKGYIRIISLCACLVLIFTAAAGYGFFAGDDQNVTPSKKDPVSAPGYIGPVCLASAQYPDRVQYPTDYDYKAFEKWYDEGRELAGLETDKSGNDDYIRKLLPAVIETKENALVSPANIYFALSMLAETTDSSSRKQILEFLGKDDIKKLRKNTSNLWQKMYKNDGTTKALLANSLWLSDSYEYSADTVDILKDSYYCSVYSGDFADKNYSSLAAEWINEQTEGLFSESLKDFEFPDDTAFSLASTIYFKAGWESKFVSVNTKKMTFHGVQKKTETEFMTGFLRTNLYSGDCFDVVSKPLSQGSMHFILPHEDKNISDVVKSEDLYHIISGDYDKLKSKEYDVTLRVPKFDISAQIDLIEVFEKQKTQKNRSMLVISHQERILKIADEIIVVANGKVRTSGTSEQILPELLRGEAESSCPINKEVF